MTPDITGLLPGRGAFETAYTTQWFFEAAQSKGNKCAGITLDLVKCFNIINRTRGIAILAHLGVPHSILEQWSRSLARLTRRWEVCGQCSESIPSSCGFPEGDVLSVVVMLGVAQCWTIACRKRVAAQALLSAYADNWAWAVCQPQEMQPILATTLRWTKIIGLRIDWDKTWWWTSHPSLTNCIRQAFESLQLPAVNRMLAVSDLGCPLRYQGAARMGKLAERLAKAKERLSRIKGLHADLEVKAKIIATSVYPVAFHGAELFPLGQQHTRSLRHHVAEALIGPSESMSAALVTLCASRFVRDPELHIILRACAAARRFLLSSDTDTQKFFLRCASQYFPRPNTSKGPASTLKAYVARLGWTIDQGGFLQVTAFIRIHLVECAWNTLVWFAEKAWQDRLLTVPSHRRALINFPNIDQHLTRTVLDKFNPKERRLLVREIAGAFQTRSQQAIWDDQVTPECLWCGQEDTKHHRFFTCTATQRIREQFAPLIAEQLEVDTLLPDLPVIFECQKEDFHCTFQFALQEKQPETELLRQLNQCLSAENPLHVYTDGSCQNPTLPTLRHAGYSVVVDTCRSDEERCWQVHRYKETGLWPTTLCVVLAELCPNEQNIHHAELRAIVRAYECFQHAIIHSDSASAIATFQQARTLGRLQMHKHPQPALCCRIQRIGNWDTNQLVKIKGHADPQDLPDLESYHALGNATADRAAEEVCLRSYPALTDSWLHQVAVRRQEMQTLQEFYQLSLQLQRYRSEHDKHSPASLNLLEQHPMRHALAFSGKMASWSVMNPWTFCLDQALDSHFYNHSYWVHRFCFVSCSG